MTEKNEKVKKFIDYTDEAIISCAESDVTDPMKGVFVKNWAMHAMEIMLNSHASLISQQQQEIEGLKENQGIMILQIEKLNNIVIQQAKNNVTPIQYVPNI